MNSILIETEAGDPIQVGTDPIQIRPAADARAPKSSFAREGYLLPYANEARNSRSAVAFPAGRWEVAWSAPVQPLSPNEFVLAVGNRFLIQQNRSWQLFDENGTALAVGARSEGELALDPDRGVFYVPDEVGVLWAMKLEDGTKAFGLLPHLAAGFGRKLVYAKDDRVAMASEELPVMSARRTPDPVQTTLEVQQLGASSETDDIGMLKSAERLASLTVLARPFHFAASDEAVIFATPGHVYVTDGLLEVTGHLQGLFEPISLSLDGAGLIHMAVSATDELENSYAALWTLNAKGERLSETRLPDRSTAPAQPLAVGFGGALYWAVGDTIYAAGVDGDIQLRQYAGGRVAGFLVTADDQLLVGAGSILATIGADGDWNVHFALEGEEWATPPVLMPGGAIAAATASRLYLLKPVQ